jgi:DNA polymerase-3 subunit gamma/tau
MLLKGLAEVRVAPDAAAAAEMVLLRIASAQAVPPPGELTRLLSEVAGGPSSQPAPVAGSRQPEPAAMQHHAGLLAVAPTLADAPAACVSADTPDCASFEALLELLKRGGERPLAAYLEEGAHLVRFAPGAVEFRPATGMPADVASRLRAAASRLSGRPWNVTLAETGGSPTLAQQRAAARAERIDELRREPAVRRVLETYPGADILELRTPVPDERLPAGPPGDRETSEVGRR